MRKLRASCAGVPHARVNSRVRLSTLAIGPTREYNLRVGVLCAFCQSNPCMAQEDQRHSVLKLIRNQFLLKLS